jgi:hypothetical protein
MRFWWQRDTRYCRVCGREWRPIRFDAVTCTDTCRKRLSRGQSFAYLAGLTSKQQRSERRYHAAVDASIAAQKKVKAAVRNYRAVKRKHREQEAERERERQLDQLTGYIYRKEEAEQHRQYGRKVVSATMRLFVSQRRNDFSAEAITEMLLTIVPASMRDEITVEFVTEILDEFKASGDHDRIIADAEANRGK